MKALVLGGTGWLGHNISKQLNAAGFDVSIGCRGKKQLFLDDCKGIKMLTLDKNSEDDMARVLAARYDIVIDTVPHDVSINLIAKYAAGLKHYIHCSSTGGYAPLPFIPCDETAPYVGFSYGGGWTQKAEVDAQVMDMHHKTGFPATVIRPCYITGAGMLPLDNLGGRRADFIPDIIAEKTLDLPDNGLSLLQPIHVEDLASSFICSAKRLNSIGQIYNITCDHAVTLNKYLELNAGAFGKKAEIEYVPLEEMLKKYPEANQVGMRFMATHMAFTNAKAKCQLGWSPRFTTADAIESTARWAADQA